MGQARKRKYNTLVTGIFTGILLPLVLFLIIYLTRYQQVPFLSFLRQLAEMNMLIKILSLCGFANLLAFFYFYRNQLDKAAKGVITATFIFAFVVLISRIL